jgi:hypothetical protein
MHDESIQIPHRKNEPGTIPPAHADSLGTYPTKLGLHLIWTSWPNGVSDQTDFFLGADCETALLKTHPVKSAPLHPVPLEHSRTSSFSSWLQAIGLI